ncbi:type I toxin-antitoxin system Ibs family toxin, partial [Escherichia coli]
KLLIIVVLLVISFPAY